MPIPALIIPLEPGKYYHVYNRGNNKEKLFYASKDYEIFLRKYSIYLGSFVTTYAYCLLPNHFHFLIRINEGYPNDSITISNQFRKLFISHARRINMLRTRTGCLMTRNFRRIEIKDDLYMKNLIRYIHFNPVKHGLSESLITYPHSSFLLYAADKQSEVPKSEVFDWFGGLEGFLEHHWGLEHDKELNCLLLDD